MTNASLVPAQNQGAQLYQLLLRCGSPAEPRPYANNCVSSPRLTVRTALFTQLFDVPDKLVIEILGRTPN